MILILMSCHLNVSVRNTDMLVIFFQQNGKHMNSSAMNNVLNAIVYIVKAN